MNASRYLLVMALLVMALLVSSAVTADSIYKWVDDKGVTHYSESPPPGGKANTLDITLEPADPASAPAVPKFQYTPAASDKSVVIYSTQWCGVCKTAKAYFRSHNVRYTEYDVETSAKGKADYARMNGTGVPIVLVGTQRMNGFNPTRFEQMMK